MFRKIFWMGLSSAIRLGTGLTLFVLIARHLGPEEFGHYMFWYGVTLLCSLLANYGLNNMLLKEVAQHPENVANALGESLSLQLTLSVGIFLCALGSSAVVDRPELLLTLLLAHLIRIISDTFYATYRALGHYARESQLAACAAIVQLILVAAAVATNQTAGIIAVAYLAGNVTQLALIFQVSKRIFGAFSPKSIRSAFRLAKCAKFYAVDNILGSAFGNIDSTVLRAYVGIDAVGIYQSGMRLFQGGAQAAPILGNVFLPELAKQAIRGQKITRSALILQTAFLSFGLIFGLILAYFSNQIVNLAFGQDYRQLITLLPLFGLLFFVRFYVASWGVLLTATGQQGYRAKSIAIYLLFMLITGSVLANRMQVQGWLIAVILANLLLGMLFMIRIIHSNLGVSPRLGIGAMLVGGLLFIPRLL